MPQRIRRANRSLCKSSVTVRCRKNLNPGSAAIAFISPRLSVDASGMRRQEPLRAFLTENPTSCFPVCRDDLLDLSGGRKQLAAFKLSWGGIRGPRQPMQQDTTRRHKKTRRVAGFEEKQVSEVVEPSAVSITTSLRQLQERRSQEQQRALRAIPPTRGSLQCSNHRGVVQDGQCGCNHRCGP